MNNGTLTVIVGLVGLYLIMQQKPAPAAPAPVPVASNTQREPTPKEIAEDVIDVLGDLYKLFDNA